MIGKLFPFITQKLDFERSFEREKVDFEFSRVYVFLTRSLCDAWET